MKARHLSIQVALFSSYIAEYVDFVPLSGVLGDVAAFHNLGSDFEGRGFPPPVKIK